MTSAKESSVGYRRPPRNTQFKRGQSGNPQGRRKSKVDAAAIANADATMVQGSAPPQMGTFEILVRKLVQRALNDNDWIALKKLLHLCEKYKVIKPPVIRSS
jgi:hypothetical protein